CPKVCHQKTLAARNQPTAIRQLPFEVVIPRPVISAEPIAWLYPGPIARDIWPVHSRLPRPASSRQRHFHFACYCVANSSRQGALVTARMLSVVIPKLVDQLAALAQHPMCKRFVCVQLDCLIANLFEIV